MQRNYHHRRAFQARLIRKSFREKVGIWLDLGWWGSPFLMWGIRAKAGKGRQPVMLIWEGSHQGRKAARLDCGTVSRKPLRVMREGAPVTKLELRWNQWGSLCWHWSGDSEQRGLTLPDLTEEVLPWGGRHAGVCVCQAPFDTLVRLWPRTCFHSYYALREWWGGRADTDIYHNKPNT